MFTRATKLVNTSSAKRVELLHNFRWLPMLENLVDVMHPAPFYRLDFMLSITCSL